MAGTLVHARVEALRRLARRRASGPLARALAKSSAGDIAEALAHLTRGETRYLFERIEDPAKVGELLLLLSEPDFDTLVKALPFERLQELLDELEPDDEADVLERLPQDIREALLARMERGDREEVEELMAWPPDSAGGIMSPVAFRLPDHTTCREAIEHLQQQPDLEMVFYAYVESEAGRLVGVTSLRNLLINPPSTRLDQIAQPDVVAVSPDTDQEEVARIAARYDLLAVPVVDQDGALLGIVTIDDVIDVIREEAVEDMLLAAGVGEELDPHGSSVIRSARSRVRFLLLTLVAGMAISEIIHGFEASLERNLVIAGFIPVVMGMSGNVGIQAATITVRNLATGHVTIGEGTGGLVFREGRVGVVMGLFFGLLLTLFCLVRYSADWKVGAAVGTSILLAQTNSAVMGTIMPLALKRIGVDPAVATGPFVTTSIDLVSITVYMLVCTGIFGL